jgi:hypothetical protein
MSSTDLEAPASVSKFASKLSTDTEMEAESAHLITADQLPESGVEEASNDTSQLSTSVATSQKDEETGSETPRSKPRYHSKISFDTIHKQIEPQHIVEYEWPLKSGERFFIQVGINLQFFGASSLVGRHLSWSKSGNFLDLGLNLRSKPYT